MSSQLQDLLNETKVVRDYLQALKELRDMTQIVIPLVKSLNQELQMASQKADELNAVLDQLPPLLEDVGNDIQFLLNGVKGGMTDAEVDAAKAKGQAIVDKLTGISKIVDSSVPNPVPPAPTPEP